MAIQWADDFSRYGRGNDSNTKMKDGLPYNNWVSNCIVDPDPIAAAKGEFCCSLSSDLSNNPMFVNRIALPTPHAGKVGLAARYWLYTLESGGSRRVIALWAGLDPVSTVYASVAVEPNGSVSLYNGRGTSLIATTGSPVISTNSWNHFESAYDSTTARWKSV